MFRFDYVSPKTCWIENRAITDDIARAIAVAVDVPTQIVAE